MNPIPKRNSEKQLQVTAYFMNDQGDVLVLLKWGTYGRLRRPKMIFRALRNFGLHETSQQEMEDCDVTPIVFVQISFREESENQPEIVIQMGAERMLSDEQDMSLAYFNARRIEDIRLFMPSKGVDATVSYARRSVPRIPPPDQE